MPLRRCVFSARGECGKEDECRDVHLKSDPSRHINSKTVTRQGKLGAGAFGVVYKGFDNIVGEFVALKEIPLRAMTLTSSSSAAVEEGGNIRAGGDDDLEDNVDEEQLNEVREEFNTLTALRHKNVVRVYNFEIDDGSGTDGNGSGSSSSQQQQAATSSTAGGNRARVARIYMELQPLGSVRDLLKNIGHRLHESVARRYIRDALFGLQYLHERSILHRDLKPANFLLSTQYHVQLSDFGTSRWVRTFGSGSGDVDGGGPAGEGSSGGRKGLNNNSSSSGFARAAGNTTDDSTADGIGMGMGSTSTSSVMMSDNNTNTGNIKMLTMDARGAAGRVVGTIPFMAPEVVREAKYSFGSDVWAIACSIIEMTTGKMPWSYIPPPSSDSSSTTTAAAAAGAAAAVAADGDASSSSTTANPTDFETPTSPPKKTMIHKKMDGMALLCHLATAKEGDHVPPLPPHLSPSLLSLLRQCFAFDPDARPSVNTLLKDPYFKNIDPNKDLNTTNKQ